ncbi:MAG: class I SAM-dependent methyltransferase [Candidatus Paceibacteria bacterium]
MANTAQELKFIYRRRFQETASYRNKVWRILTTDFFSRWITKDHVVLDVGCGWGEFINHVSAGHKFGIDLNPDTRHRLNKDIQFFEQDCSTQWPLPNDTLDVVFTSNFFEHLPTKAALSATLKEAYTALKEGGKLIAMGPNIKYLPGSYWDFFDHHIPLSDMSLAEAMEFAGFEIEYIAPRFLPYTLVNAPEYPLFLLKIYLKMPWLWWIKGRQFLIVGRK